MFEPMLATLADARLDDPTLVYEPKYDGIRAIADVAAGGTSVRLWSRLGNDKTAQFPEIAEALARWAKRHSESVVLDGEIVALDANGRPAGFQHLQGRIHVLDMVKARRFRRSPSRVQGTSAARTNRAAGPSPPAPVAVAFIAFDLLRVGHHDLRPLPLTDRRAALVQLFGARRSTTLRLSEQVHGDGRAMQARALAEGWEGLIAKRASSTYRSGKRSPDWRKLKIVHEQEFVVGGWSEPRHSRSHFGSLIVGIYDDAPNRAGEPSRVLRYAGHVGTGFDERELTRVMALMKPLEISSCPFSAEPPTNEQPHWVTPTLVAQVRFAEWTMDGVLRHPVYLGLRDDARASAVRREVAAPSPASSGSRLTSAKAGGAASARADDNSGLVDQLLALEKSGKDGVLEIAGGGRLKVTNLRKVFWPDQPFTKGDLLRYYAQMAAFALPVIADRPLVMKRFPNGIAGEPFYQHRVDEAPAGVRIEPVEADDAIPHIIGGDILTLLYTTQLAAISQDPWFSRVQSPGQADFVAIDLDPPPDCDFARVLSAAGWVRDELARFGVSGFAKTSGADGAHIYIPLAAGTPYEAAVLFAQIVATLVAERHPRETTTERSVKKRGTRIYLDYLQNGLGKTLASAYSARASSYAGVSTPLTWQEVDRGVRREDFTIASVPARVREVGDLWAALRTSTGVDLATIVNAAPGAAPKTRPRHSGSHGGGKIKP